MLARPDKELSVTMVPGMCDPHDAFDNSLGYFISGDDLDADLFDKVFERERPSRSRWFGTRSRARPSRSYRENHRSLQAHS
jgi:hypothetical protein